MALPTGQWFSIARKMFDEDSDFYGDAILIALWTFILAKANWKDSTHRLKRQDVIVKRGQFPTSQDRLARAIGCSRKAVRNALDYLEKTGRLGQQKTHDGTIITVLKYDEYQTPKQDIDQEGASQGNSEGPAGVTAGVTAKGQRRATLEQINNSTREQDNKLRVPAADQKPPKSKSPKSPSSAEPTPGSLVWDAYASAYKGRYGNDPVRNKTTNSICKRLAERLGVEDAIEVVKFYLTHNKGYYVQRVHALDACLKDCEGLHTQRLHNFRVTAANARQQEIRQTNAQNFQAAAERLVDKHIVKVSEDRNVDE